MINKIFLFPNGQVIVFNGAGFQMPEYQGDFKEAIPKIIQTGWRGVIIVQDWKIKE